jgi:hypothetical protein
VNFNGKLSQKDKMRLFLRRIVNNERPFAESHIVEFILFIQSLNGKEILKALALRRKQEKVSTLDTHKCSSLFKDRLTGFLFLSYSSP